MSFLERKALRPASALFKRLALALLLFPAALSPGAETPPPAEAPAAEEASLVQFNFEQAEIRLVTELVSKLTGRRFIIPETISGKVSILTQDPIPLDEVYPVYLSMLEASGYTATSTGDGLLRISPLVGAPALSSGVTKVIPLQHVSAVDVKKAVEPLVRGGKEGALEVFAPGNHLIVTDTEANIARVEALVAELDRPGTASTIEVVPLEHADAEDLAARLRTILSGTLSAGDRVHQHMQQVTGGAGSLPEGVAIVAAPQANRIVLSGDPRQIERLRGVIARMDVENPNGFGRLNAIFLQYLSAEEAAKSLNALLGRTAEKETGRRPIGIEPSIGNNALLVDASPQDFEYVRRLVERLDEVPQQVLVEVLIAEADIGDTLDLGVEWMGIDQPSGGGSGSFARTRYGASDSPLAVVTNFSTPPGLALGFLDGTVTIGGIEYPQLPFYLRAAATDSRLKILSDIPLWAQNNLEASVSVVENIPILTSSVEGSGSDRDYIQNIERLDVGIKLKLTPHVNPRNEIQLDLNPSIESIVEKNADDASNYTPTISKSEVNTTVTIPDRSTVVISGLIREHTTKIVTKVPWLGDIPLLGWLFRSTADSTSRKNLLIFVTPRIVTDPAMALAEGERLQRNTGLAGALDAFEVPPPPADAAPAPSGKAGKSRKSAAAAVP